MNFTTFLILSPILIFLWSLFLLLRVIPIKLPPEIYSELEKKHALQRRKQRKKIEKTKVILKRKGVVASFGRTVDGNHRVSLPLATNPTILLCGLQGSGKSRMIESAILSIASYTPNVEFRIMGSPKDVQYTTLVALPQKTTIALNEEDWDRTLKEVEKEMLLRAEKLAKAKMENPEIIDVISMNEKSSEKIPYIILIADELQRIVAKKLPKNREIVNHILEQGRSVGIYFIGSTQVQTKEDLGGKIISKIGVKIAGQMANSENSKIVLGKAGAEMLNPEKEEAIINSYNYPFTLFRPKRFSYKEIIKEIKEIKKLHS